MKQVLFFCFALLLCVACTQQHDTTSESVVNIAPELDRSNFVYITDIIPSVILEIRYHSTFNFVGTRIDGYTMPVALCTRQAAEALKNVADNLMQQGYRLKIYDAYRPQKAVDHFVRWAKTNDTLMRQYFYPQLNKDQLFPLGFICAQSSHTRGSTIDLTLFDMKTGKDVDMGANFDWFGEESHPDYEKLSDAQKANRKLLRDAMTAANFLPFDTEWWHFTLNNEPYPNTYFNFDIE